MDLKKAISLVKKDPFNLSKLDEDLINHPDIALQAVSANGTVLEFAGDQAKDNKTVVMAAVRRDPVALHYASARLQDDEEVILAGLEQDWGNRQNILFNASERIRQNRDIVLRALAQSGDQLECLSDEYRNDPGLVKQLLENGHDITFYYGDKIKSNQEIILLAANEFATSLNKDNVSPELLADREFVLKLIKQGFNKLQYLSSELCNDKTIVKKILKHFNGQALEYASQDLRDDADLVLLAIKNSSSGNSLKFASQRLKSDAGFILKAVKINGRSLSYADPVFGENREIVLTACENQGYALQSTSETLLDDEEVIMTAIRNEPRAFEYASDRLRNDNHFIEQAIKHSPEVIEYIGDQLTPSGKIKRSIYIMQFKEIAHNILVSILMVFQAISIVFRLIAPLIIIAAIIYGLYNGFVFISNLFN